MLSTLYGCYSLACLTAITTKFYCLLSKSQRHLSKCYRRTCCLHDPMQLSLLNSCQQHHSLCCGAPRPCRSHRKTTLRVQSSQHAEAAKHTTSRRCLLHSAGVLAAALALPHSALAGKTPDVGSYLPKSSKSQGLVDFKPDKNKTPAIRSGVIRADDSYSFSLPPGFSEQPVANIQSGNFCMPKCGEPWTEVIFAGSEGKVMVLVSPLEKLTFKVGASVKDIGPPEALLGSFGPYITGTELEEEDVLSRKVGSINGRPAYEYESFAPYGTNGTHQLSKVVTKDKCAYLFVASANDKQWPKGEKVLRQVVDSFTV